MKAPDFLEGVGIAILAAVSGEMLFWMLPWFIGKWLASLLVMGLLSLSYVLYLLHRAAEKTGRITLLACWVLGSCTAGVLHISLWSFLLLQLGFIWLTRSLYFRAGLFGALADLGLHALAAIAAVWAFAHSGSMLLAIWSFFLVQALFPLLPAAKPSNSDIDREPNGVNTRFEQAHRTALLALQRLSTR